MRTTMMKSLFVAVLAINLSVFAGVKNPIKLGKSTVSWIGKKVTGAHEGTIALKAGDVILEDGALAGGTFVVDMTTIDVTDLEGEYKGKLEGHLKSDDFFGVAKFPEATFVITSVEGSIVKGDLTIKGHTEEQSFDLITKDNTISGKVMIDRTKFGIKYGSGSFFDNLKDKAIDDEFELNVNILF